MAIKPVFAALLMLELLPLNAILAYGQSYPTKTIRIVTADAGGGVDFASRIVAPGLASAFGQQVIIENRRGNVATPVVEPLLHAPPDGYMLLLYGNPLWLLPFMQDNLPYDPVRDFSPLTLTHRSPNILVVHPSVPARSVKELIALAKARPGELNYGVSGLGSMTQLAAELFNVRAGVKIVGISYKSGAQVLIALVGGEMQLIFANAGSAAPHLKTGKLRALGVTSAQPSALAPGLPTIASAGLPGFEATSFYGMFAPAKTPPAIINRLNQEIVRVLNAAEAKERFLALGSETIPSSPEEFAAAIRSDMTNMGKLIKDLGIRAE